MRLIILVFGIASIAAAAPARAQTADSAPSGLNFCPAPHPPACIELEESYARQASLDSCSARVQHFVDSVFAYRECLSREITRAIAETNAASKLFKCRSSGLAKCK